VIPTWSCCTGRAPAGGSVGPCLLTAQAAYKALLSERLAPVLREHGFKGSGNEFVLPDDDDWLLVGFQKSRYSEAARVAFMSTCCPCRNGSSGPGPAQKSRGQEPGPSTSSSTACAAVSGMALMVRSTGGMRRKVRRLHPNGRTANGPQH
jgi:hypothetical protein